MRNLCKRRLNSAGHILLLCVAFLYMAGCASRQARLPQEFTPAKPPEYRLGFGDQVVIRFTGNDELTDTLVVRPDGRLSIPLLDDVPVEGMSLTQLDQLVEARYRGVILDPEVVVNLISYGGTKAYVMGEVNNPGAHEVRRNMTLTQLMASAGSTTDDARSSAVWVIRRRAPDDVRTYQVDGREDAESSGGKLVANEFLVKPSDIVYVPETFMSRALGTFQEIFSTLVIPPFEVYFQFLILDTQDE